MLEKKKSISVSIFFLLFPKVQTHITWNKSVLHKLHYSQGTVLGQ